MKETPDPGLNNKSVISGHITDRDDKEPMIAATIILNNGKYNGEYKAVSDVRGFFIFKNIPPGNYQVKQHTWAINLPLNRIYGSEAIINMN